MENNLDRLSVLAEIFNRNLVRLQTGEFRCLCRNSHVTENILNCNTIGGPSILVGPVSAGGKVVVGCLRASSAGYIDGKQISSAKAFIGGEQAIRNIVLPANASIDLCLLPVSRLNTYSEDTETIVPKGDRLIVIDKPSCFDLYVRAAFCNEIAGENDCVNLSSSKVLEHQFYTEIADICKKSEALQFRLNDRALLFSRSISLLFETPFAFRNSADLAKVVHCSVRTIEKTFKSILKMTPGALIRAIQLNTFRQTVIERSRKKRIVLANIASELGVINYSRFSKNYTEFFGENPRATSIGSRKSFLADKTKDG